MEQSEINSKICNKCQIFKVLKEYSYRKARNKYLNTCKDCLSLKARVKCNGEEGRGYVAISNGKGDDRYNFDINKIITIEKYQVNRRCEYELCRCLLPEFIKGSSMVIKRINDKNKYYCNKWCREEANPPELKIKGTCKCGNATHAIKRTMTKVLKGGIIKEYIVRSGMYAKYCEECKGKKN